MTTYRRKSRMGVKPKTSGKKQRIAKRPAALANKIVRLERMVLRNQPEKKKYTTLYDAAPVGQCSVNLTGAYVADLTPLIQNGANDGQRVGSDVRLKSMAFKYMLSHQANTQSPMKFKCYIISSTGVSVSTASDALSRFLSPNVFTNVVDYGSERNQEQFGSWRILKAWNETLRPDNFSGQLIAKQGMRAFKCNHQIKYSSASSQSYVAGQLWFICVADVGNSGATASGIPNIAITGPNTGASMTIGYTAYYLDN